MQKTNEEVLKEILEQSLAGYWDWDIPSGNEYLSPSFKRMFGYEDHEIENRADSWQKLIFQEDLPKVFEKFNQHLKSKGQIPFYNEVRYHHKGGSTVWVICTGKVIEWDENGNAKRMVGCHIDISERKQAEESLRQSEERFHSLFEKAPLGYQSLDADGNFIEVNHAWLETLGYSREEVIGKWFGDFLAPEYVQAFREKFSVFKAQGRIHSEFFMLHKNGSKRFIAFDGRIGHNSDGSFKQTHCILKDETERKFTEETLANAQKLESLGVLAGGIAHDFNNLMGGIFGFVEIAKQSSTDDKVNRDLTKVMQTINRARNLTQQLLTFAKGGAPQQEIAPLFPFLQQAAEFALSGSNVSCHFDFEETLWSANYDKNQLGQVIDNLIINAQQAMPLGGTIELSARNVTFKSGEHPLLTEGNYVQIFVTDTGIGIPHKIQNRIFDPFFTTKAKGHGLGLATSYSIIKRHGGCIDVSSEPDKGSTFTIYLPASLKIADKFIDSKTKTHSGTGMFLIMDDEEVIRDSISIMLESFGYSVICTANGEGAITHVLTALKEDRAFAGLLFDITVPGAMGGEAAIEQIRKLGVTSPAFVASGYSDDPIIKNPEQYGFTASICKPFMRSELIDLLDKHMKKHE